MYQNLLLGKQESIIKIKLQEKSGDYYDYVEVVFNIYYAGGVSDVLLITPQLSTIPSFPSLIRWKANRTRQYGQRKRGRWDSKREAKN